MDYNQSHAQFKNEAKTIADLIKLAPILNNMFYYLQFTLTATKHCKRIGYFFLYGD